MNEVLKAWTTLKEKLQSVIQHNQQLHYLFSLETSLKHRAEENRQYEDRLRQVEERTNQLGKKLEVVRGLISEGQLEKLSTLYQHGKI